MNVMAVLMTDNGLLSAMAFVSVLHYLSPFNPLILLIKCPGQYAQARNLR
jgi:hypothetical protein